MRDPRTVLRAAKLIRTGQVIELGHVLDAKTPTVPGRVFEMVTKRTNPAAANRNHRGSNEELLVAEIGQIGTQLDGFAHNTIGGSMYNCVRADDIATRNGFEQLGIEHVGAIFTRGVLLDVARAKGVANLESGYEITVDDLKATLDATGLQLEPGDAILIRTGWGRFYGVDNAQLLASEPGLGIAAAEWLAAKDPLLVGADTNAVDVMPNPDPSLSVPVHQIMLVVHGVYLLENLKLDELAAQNVTAFAFSMHPLKLKGATGSTVAPAAIR